MTKTIACYSRKRAAWVRYDRPTRFEAMLNARVSHGQAYDPIERATMTGCLPLVWAQRHGQFASKHEAETAA